MEIFQISTPPLVCSRMCERRGKLVGVTEVVISPPPSIGSWVWEGGWLGWRWSQPAPPPVHGTAQRRLVRIELSRREACGSPKGAPRHPRRKTPPGAANVLFLRSQRFVPKPHPLFVSSEAMKSGHLTANSGNKQKTNKHSNKKNQKKTMNNNNTHKRQTINFKQTNIQTKNERTNKHTNKQGE